MTSEGDASPPSGLVPERYDEDTQVVMRDRRRMSVVFEPRRGRARQRPAARAPRRRAGHGEPVHPVHLPVLDPARAAARRQRRRVPAGAAAHDGQLDLRGVDEQSPRHAVRPARGVPSEAAAAADAAPGELTVELWIAPELRYLPVRIRIEQDAATFIDLMIASKPEIGARRRAVSLRPNRQGRPP